DRSGVGGAAHLFPAPGGPRDRLRSGRPAWADRDRGDERDSAPGRQDGTPSTSGQGTGGRPTGSDPRRGHRRDGGRRESGSDPAVPSRPHVLHYGRRGMSDEIPLGKKEDLHLELKGADSLKDPEKIAREVVAMLN